MCGLKGRNTIDSLVVRSQNSLEPREVLTGSGELGVEYIPEMKPPAEHRPRNLLPIPCLLLLAAAKVLT